MEIRKVKNDLTYMNRQERTQAFLSCHKGLFPQMKNPREYIENFKSEGFFVHILKFKEQFAIYPLRNQKILLPKTLSGGFTLTGSNPLLPYPGPSQFTPSVTLSLHCLSHWNIGLLLYLVFNFAENFFHLTFSAMEVSNFCFTERTVWIGSVAEAMVVETMVAVGKSLACLLILVLLLNSSFFPFILYL